MDESSGWDTRRTIWIVVAIFVVAVGGLYGWAQLIHLWADHRNYASVGAFGDAFAPVVGCMTALALAAAITSVFMQRTELELQRREMREARVQYERQAVALGQQVAEQSRANRLAKEANRIARQANEIARAAQTLEILRQIAEIDRLGVELIREIGAAGVAPPFEDPARKWQEVRSLDPHDFSKIPRLGELFSGTVRELIRQRREVEGLRSAVETP